MAKPTPPHRTAPAPPPPVQTDDQQVAKLPRQSRLVEPSRTAPAPPDQLEDPKREAPQPPRGPEGRPDLVEACTQPEFVWRSRQLLLELSGILGKLEYEETLELDPPFCPLAAAQEASSGAGSKPKSAGIVPLAAMLDRVAGDIKEAAESNRAKAPRLHGMARAFEQAARWETLLYGARDQPAMRGKISYVRKVTTELYAALSALSPSDDSSMVIFPGGPRRCSNLTSPGPIF
jgi:hypothetical protein